MSRAEHDEYEDDAYDDAHDSADELEAWLDEQSAREAEVGEYVDEAHEEGDEYYDEDEDPHGDDQHFVQHHEVRTGSSSAVVFGILLAFTGVAWAVAAKLVPAAAEFSSDVSSVGLTPFGLALIGIVVAAFGKLQNGQSTGSGDDQHATLDALDDLKTHLEGLASNQSNSGGSDALAEDVARVTMLLQRQDEKIANLTRATKMYGQPLVEITTQVNDLVAQQKDSIDGMSAARQELAALESKLQELRDPLDALGQLDLTGPLREALTRVTEAVQSTVGEVRASVDETREAIAKSVAGKLDEVAEQTRPVAAAVERLGTRFDGIESALESNGRRVASEVGNEVTAAVQKLGSGIREDLEENSRKLREQLREVGEQTAKAAEAAAANTGSAPAVDLSGVESTLDQLRRDVAGVSTSMSRVATNMQRAPASASPAPAPQAATAPAAAPAQAPAATGDQPAGAKPPGGLAHSIAGQRNGGGKNVLGAIAKLKQMRN